MKKHWAWIRTREITGTYPLATSLQTYINNIDAFDTVMPMNGGRLQPDGTWLQSDSETDTDFARNLKDQAHAAGQLYMPSVSANLREQTMGMPVLESPDLQLEAINNLLNLSITRFDAPWDGVDLDLEHAPAHLRSEMSAFWRLLSYHLRSAGLHVNITIGARESDPPNWYGQDYHVVGQVADTVTVMSYGYWVPLPRSFSPYWYFEASIKHMINEGIPPGRLIMGIGTYAKYWPITGDLLTRYELSYPQAIAIIQANNSFTQWIESNENGIIRERYADIGEGHIWFPDADVNRHRLELCDKYQLLGAGTFSPGIGDPNYWPVINEWRS